MGGLKHSLSVSALSVLTQTQVQAQAPLSIEQLIVDDSRLQLSAGLLLRDRTPTTGVEDRDSLWSTTLRYGLSPRLEVNANLDWNQGELRQPGRTQHRQGHSYGLGGVWQARREDSWPAIVIEARGDSVAGLADNDERVFQGQLAATLYRSIDPVVLSLRVSYLRQESYHLNGGRFRPGDQWRAEPMVNFAVNPQVTLLGGMALSIAEASSVDGEPVFNDRDAISLRAGLGYAPNRNNTLFLLGELSGEGGGSQFSLQYQYQF